MEKLHPGARWIFRVNSYITFLGLIIFVSIINLQIVLTMGGVGKFIYVLLGMILFLFVVGEIYTRLAYNNWAYEFTKQGLKTERGIIWKKYTSIPYEGVQNVDIHRGILARIFGFSSLNVQTAGSSYAGKGNFSEGYIPALEPQTAEKIRESLMSHISSKGI